MVREDLAMIENAVSVAVLEQPDFVVRMLFHLVVVQRVAGGLGDEQAAAIVEGPHHRIGAQLRTRREFHLESWRDPDRAEAGEPGRCARAEQDE